ncbi:MAG: hypothetical protein H6668_15465 [Ardenticatenaceae bacterium]|nr:hypothetical protein [Ardenticatenaceae bacterium]
MTLLYINLRQAWAGLWEEGKTAVFSPLEPLTLGALETVMLTSREPWGRVGLRLSGSEIGLPETADAMTPPVPTGPNGRFAAQIVLPVLNLFGNYAIQTAADVNPFSPLADAADNGTDPSPLDLARQQRDRLNSSDNGSKLVTLYYQHNEILNGLMQNPNVQSTWQNQLTNGQTTKYYMDHTYNALLPENIGTALVDRTPDDQSTSGPTYYQSHGFYMAWYMQGLCDTMHDHLQTSDPETAVRYKNASDDIGTTIRQTYGNGLAPQHSQDAQITNTGENVYSKVNAANTSGFAADAVEAMPDYLQALREQARVDIANSGFAPAAFLAARAPAWTNALTGTYTVTLDKVVVTLSGTAVQANNRITVTITQVDADLPPAAVELSGHDGDALLTAVQPTLTSSSFVSQMIASHLRGRLDQPDVRTFFANLLNTALAGGN